MTDTRIAEKTKPRQGDLARNAAIYCRISDDREGQGLGVERQRQECQRLAGTLGWAMYSLYVDNDIGAFEGKPRPEFERMVEDIKAGHVNAIVSWAPARLTRHNRELEDLIDLLDAHSVEVATHIAGKYDLSTSGGRLVARVVGAVARHESEEKSERIKLKMEEIATKGGFHGGKRPYGYEKDGVTVRPEEAEVVRSMAKSVLEGLSGYVVAQDLNARGVPSATGKTWSYQSVYALLTKPRIAGLRCHQGEVIGEAAWPAIIDRATFDELQAVIVDPRRKRRRATSHLLTGLLFTADDPPRKLVGGRRPVAGGEASVYACPAQRSPTGAKLRPGVAIDGERLEYYVVQYVLDHTDRATVPQPSGRAAEAGPSEVATLEKLLEDVAKERANGELTFREWRVMRDRLTARLEEARTKVPDEPRVPAGVAALLGRKGALRKSWDDLSPRAQQRALAAVLEKVIIKPVGSGRRGFDPDRVIPFLRKH